MFIATQLIGFGDKRRAAAGGGTAARSFTDSFSFFDSGTYSEVGASIGAAAADRLVAIVVNGFNLTSLDGIDSVTIGGVAATAAIERLRNFGGSGLGMFSSIYWAAVPTGTTATITLTFTGDDIEGTVAVYRITGANTTSPIAATGGNDVASGSVSASVTPGNGTATLAGALAGFNSGASSSSWTNATEDFDSSVDPAGIGTFLNTSAASRADAGSPGAISIAATSASADAGAEKTLAIAIFTP